MAVQVETQGQLAEFLEILSRRRWQVLLPAALVLTFGAAAAVFVPKKYLVTTAVEIHPVSISVSGKDADSAPKQINSPTRVKKVLLERKNTEFLALTPQAQQGFVTDVQGDIKVKLDKPSAASSFVSIEYTHTDPVWAAEFLKALRDDWKGDVLERDKNKVNEEAETLRAQVNSLDKELKSVEEALTSQMKRKAISPTQPIPGGSASRNEDPDYTRLQANKTLLGATELELASAEGLVKHLTETLKNTPDKLSEQQVIEGVSNSSEVRDLETQILDKQTELERYTPNNSKYPKIKKKLESLREQLDAAKKLATRNELTNIQKVNPARAELQTRLDQARQQVDQLTIKQEMLAKSIDSDSHGVDELYPVYSAITLGKQKASRLEELLKATSLRYEEKLQQAKQLASPLADPFTITQDVTVPDKPTEPNPWLIVAFSLVAGLALGLTVALTAEYSRNCFRNVHDISRVMVAPVLGSVNRISTRRQQRLTVLRHVLIATASATVIGVVAFVTWAWARNPDLLSSELRARIEFLQKKMR